MAIHRDMIVTTTGTIEGYEIKEYLGVISTQVVAGTNIFSDIAAGCLFGLGKYGYELALRAAAKQLLAPED